jgi:hypothetical protein
MENVAHNGFECPYCRTKMAADVAPDEETIYTDTDDEDEDDEENEEDNYRGYRLFWNNINDEQPAEEDMADEQEFELLLNAEEQRISNLPSPAAVAQKLQEQGFTFEQLVSLVLVDHNNYYYETPDVRKLNGKLYAKVKHIITDYKREPEPEPEPEPAPEPEPEPEQISREQHRRAFYEYAKMRERLDNLNK